MEVGNASHTIMVGSWEFNQHCVVKLTCMCTYVALDCHYCVIIMYCCGHVVMCPLLPALFLWCDCWCT